MSIVMYIFINLSHYSSKINLWYNNTSTIIMNILYIFLKALWDAWLWLWLKLGHFGTKFPLLEKLMKCVSVMTCASAAWFATQWVPLGTCWVSSMYKHWDGAKGASSTTALAHWFPPPSSSGCLLRPNGQDTGTWDLVESKFISRLGDCSSGPQWLIYVCTWEWLIESKWSVVRWVHAWHSSIGLNCGGVWQFLHQFFIFSPPIHTFHNVKLYK